MIVIQFNIIFTIICVLVSAETLELEVSELKAGLTVCDFI